MSTELKNITNNVMEQIHKGKAKMKPRLYFILGSILTFIGLVFSFVFSTFLIGLIKFSLRSHGRMGEYKLDQMISNFPWWTMVLAIASLVVGILLIRKYDFSYKKNPIIIVLVFILSIIFMAFMIDTIGVNDKMHERGPMKKVMRKYSQDKNIKDIQQNSPKRNFYNSR